MTTCRRRSVCACVCACVRPHAAGCSRCLCGGYAGGLRHVAWHAERVSVSGVYVYIRSCQRVRASPQTWGPKPGDAARRASVACLCLPWRPAGPQTMHACMHALMPFRVLGWCAHMRRAHARAQCAIGRAVPPASAHGQQGCRAARRPSPCKRCIRISGRARGTALANAATLMPLSVDSRSRACMQTGAMEILTRRVCAAMYTRWRAPGCLWHPPTQELHAQAVWPLKQHV